MALFRCGNGGASIPASMTFYAAGQSSQPTQGRMSIPRELIDATGYTKMTLTNSPAGASVTSDGVSLTMTVGTDYDIPNFTGLLQFNVSSSGAVTGFNITFKK